MDLFICHILKRPIHSIKAGANTDTQYRTLSEVINIKKNISANISYENLFHLYLEEHPNELLQKENVAVVQTENSKNTKSLTDNKCKTIDGPVNIVWT